MNTVSKYDVAEIVSLISAQTAKPGEPDGGDFGALLSNVMEQASGADLAAKALKAAESGESLPPASVSSATASSADETNDSDLLQIQTSATDGNTPQHPQTDVDLALQKGLAAVNAKDTKDASPAASTANSAGAEAKAAQPIFDRKALRSEFAAGGFEVAMSAGKVAGKDAGQPSATDKLRGSSPLTSGDAEKLAANAPGASEAVLAFQRATADRDTAESRVEPEYSTKAPAVQSRAEPEYSTKAPAVQSRAEPEYSTKAPAVQSRAEPEYSTKAPAVQSRAEPEYLTKAPAVQSRVEPEYSSKTPAILDHLAAMTGKRVMSATSDSLKQDYEAGSKDTNLQGTVQDPRIAAGASVVGPGISAYPASDPLSQNQEAATEGTSLRDTLQDPRFAAGAAVEHPDRGVNTEISVKKNSGANDEGQLRVTTLRARRQVILGPGSTAQADPSVVNAGLRSNERLDLGARDGVEGSKRTPGSDASGDVASSQVKPIQVSASISQAGATGPAAPINPDQPSTARTGIHGPKADVAYSSNESREAVVQRTMTPAQHEAALDQQRIVESEKDDTGVSRSAATTQQTSGRSELNINATTLSAQGSQTDVAAVASRSESHTAKYGDTRAFSQREVAPSEEAEIRSEQNQPHSAETNRAAASAASKVNTETGLNQPTRFQLNAIQQAAAAEKSALLHQVTPNAEPSARVDIEQTRANVEGAPLLTAAATVIESAAGEGGNVAAQLLAAGEKPSAESRVEAQQRPVNASNFTNDMRESILGQLSRTADGTSKFTVSLYPENYGKIDVEVSYSETGGLRIHLQGDSPESVRLLEQNLQALRESLQSDKLSELIVDSSENQNTKGSASGNREPGAGGTETRGEERDNGAAQEGADEGQAISVSARETDNQEGLDTYV